MSEIDTLLFCDPDFVGGEPAVDGFFDVDYMLTGEKPDGGYIGGSQLTIGASGIAPVVFRGIRKASNNHLVMAFMCRFSSSFEADNAVVIALKPTPGDADQGNARKIVIFPVASGTGADSGVGSGPYQIKTDKPPVDVDYYKGITGGGWEDASPSNITVKVRSWVPSITPAESAWSIEVELPIAKAGAGGGGGDWIDLANDFGLYFSVIKIVPVGSGTATQYWFPAVMNGGVGPIVETWTPSTYGHGIIPHTSGQSLPSNVYPGVGFDDPWMGIGCRPANQPTGSPLTGTIVGNGAPAGTPDNHLVAKLRNNGANAAHDIQCEFRFHRYGLGPADPLLWDAPVGIDPNPAPRRDGGSPQPQVDVNPGETGKEIVALWKRNDPSLLTVASQDTCMWAQLSARTPVTFFQSSTRRNMSFVNLSEVEKEVVVSGRGYDAPPDGGPDQDFIIQTFCRGVNVAELIEQHETADPTLVRIVGQSLLGARKGDGVAVAHELSIKNIKATGAAGAYKNSVVFIWQSFGYRVTDQTITIRGTTYPLLDNGCGAFGMVAHHEGVQDGFGWSFEGDRMVRYGPALYGLKVPNGGEAVIKVRLTAAPDGPRGDGATKLPPGKFDPPRGGPGINPPTGPGQPNGPGGAGGAGGGDLPRGCLAFLMPLFRKTS